jgi:uncharacterized protein
MIFDFELHTVVIAALVVVFGYIIFGISAFGAALITVPVLSHLFPLDFVLPMSVLLDVTAAVALGTRFSREADWGELKWMGPLCLVGAVMGVTLLVNLPRQATLVAFGIFLVLYGIYGLRLRGPGRQVGWIWGPVAGFTGGITGTLFGIGAPPYAIYLSHRLQGKLELRATLSNMVLLSTTIRATVFAVSGFMLADRLIMFAILAPFALGGLWIGNRLQGRVSRVQLGRIISGLVLLIGVSVFMRALG